MDLNLINAPFDLRYVKPGELEEILEDPFALRFLPDEDRKDGLTRFYTIGRTIADRHLFLAFTTDGKVATVAAAREMSESERRFYDRNYNETR